MTFRAKPVVKRAHRPSWETQDRRNLYLNLGFGLIVVIAVVILAIAAGLTYYNDHLASVGSRRRPVDHQGRLQRPAPGRDLASGRGRTRSSDRGRRRSPDRGAGRRASSRPSTQQRQQLPAITLERLIDSKLQAKLASGEGVTRHAAGHRRPAGGRGDHARAAPRLGHRGRAGDRQRRHRPDRRAEGGRQGQGRAGAQGHHTAARPGRTSPRPSRPMPRPHRRPATSAGSRPTTRSADEAFLKALFAAPVNTPTAVVEGSDGIFRIGRATEISPDVGRHRLPGQDRRTTASAIDHYRTVVAADVLHQKLAGQDRGRR